MADSYQVEVTTQTRRFYIIVATSSKEALKAAQNSPDALQPNGEDTEVRY